ncbi:MAG: metalloregulator ArsR/SmtB family transcription factor [Hyphomicrobiaceae bacterium]|nr:metalloregulator ArsR/SmtB family transcription factor [Hyphomicrobiaceae bacterium]
MRTLTAETPVLDQRTVLAMLRAAAEPTRLRVLALLAPGELSVKDLTRILNQSQPRISRHLKLMAEAGLVERVRDGSWAYFQLVDSGPRGELARGLLASIDPADPVLARDRQRAVTVKLEREAAAQTYFRENAAEWDRIRSLHVAEREVEAAVCDAFGPGPFDLLVDLGTGTGRMLELLADRYVRAVGFDINHTMLAYARSKLETAGATTASVRHGDLYDVALEDGAADAVIMHQVLHFLTEPQQAIREAARVLAPGGRLVIVDFAAHGLEFLREEFAHERLGFTDVQVTQWLTDAGLETSPPRRLDQAGGDSKARLTVMLWTARRPGADRAASRHTRQSKVEA